MPLSAIGKLRIVASADLGGLGARNGLPVFFDWTLRGVAPMLMPWLFVIALLALPRNRSGLAWWIWAPLGLVTTFSLFPPMLPSGAGFAVDLMEALAFGLAAVWLLASRSSHRFFTFTRSLLVLGVFSGALFLLKQSGSRIGQETLGEGIVLAVGVLITSIALALAGWLCRRRSDFGGIHVWLLVSLAVIWLLLASPFILLALISSGGPIPVLDFVLPLLVVIALNYATLLPFLILSSANSFYRERLDAMLQ